MADRASSRVCERSSGFGLAFGVAAGRRAAPEAVRLRGAAAAPVSPVPLTVRAGVAAGFGADGSARGGAAAVVVAGGGAPAVDGCPSGGLAVSAAGGAPAGMAAVDES